MSDMIEKLQTLTEPQLQKVFRLIDKLASKNDSGAIMEPEESENEPDERPIKRQQPKSKPNSHSIRQENPSRAVGRPSGGLERKISAGSRKVGKSKGGGVKGRKTKTFTRREPMNLSGNRPNLFDKMAESKQHKADHALDQKLNISPPTPRRSQMEFVEAECSGCGDLYEVNPALVYQTDEGLMFTCSHCTRTSR